MAAIDFPSNPSLNQEVTLAGITYAWNGQGWIVKGSGGGGGSVTDIWVDAAGDTMTGPLILSGDPTVPLGAMTKQYVDNKDYLKSANNSQVVISDTAFGYSVGGALKANFSAVGDLFCEGFVEAGNLMVLRQRGAATSGLISFTNAANATIADIAYGHSTGIITFRVATVTMNFDQYGNLAITGPVGTKSVGGDWAAPSDARIKTVTGDYTAGLAAIQQIRPVRFEFNGNLAFEEGGPAINESALGQEFIGLVAQEAESVMPEMVTQSTGFIDGQQVSDLRVLDTTALTYALINAVKELSARVEALEGAGGATVVVKR